MDATGDFVIAWTGYVGHVGAVNVVAQRYNASGVTQGSNFALTTPNNVQFAAAVAMDSTGDFVISCTSADGGSGNVDGIFAQRYSASGSAQGSAFRVNTYITQGQENSSVAMDSGGDFVVTWDSFVQDGSGAGVYAQAYNNAGKAQGSEFRVNTYTTSEQSFPAVSMDSSGDFVIAWQSLNQDNPGGVNYGIYAQRYSSASAGSTLTINGAASSNNVQITFTDATHFNVTINNGTPTSYSTATATRVVYNGPSGTFSQVVFSDPFNTYAAVQSFASTNIVGNGFEFDANNVANLYIYAGSGTSTATISVASGTGSNFFVASAAGGYSYIANPATGTYSELSGFPGETVTGSGGTTYAYVYSTSHASAVGNSAGSKLTVGGVTSNLSNFPQVYFVGAADGTDSVLLDSGGGTFVATPGFDYVGGTTGGSSFLIGALYAANVTAEAAGSTDTAVFYSYPQNTFNGTLVKSTLTGSTSNVNGSSVSFFVQASDYSSVSVFESGAGSDVANLVSTGNGSFFGTPTASIFSVGPSKVTVNTYFTPTGGQPTAVPSVIVVTGNHDGTDQAVLNDSPGANALVVGGSQAVLTTSLGSVMINKFGAVTATKGNGSSNTQKLTSAIDFVLTATGWTPG